MYPLKSSLLSSTFHPPPSQLPNHNQEKYSNQILEKFNESVQKSSSLIEDANKQSASIQLLREPDSKYPLQCSWSFWFFKNQGLDWHNNLILLTSVEYVEDFWAVHNYLKPVNELANGRDYMLFKTGIKPMWEDSKNLNGGRWLLTVEKTKQPCKNLSNFWVNSMVSLIGSQYDEESSFVNGVVMNIRHKFNKLALWTSEATNEAIQNKIGKRFKRLLNVKSQIVFEIHKKEVLAFKENETVCAKKVEPDENQPFSVCTNQ